ncbi:MAG TPA: SDR family oxidoreductase [Streptosporangiaceae bacterium]|nr:SDR family oxidoreductase [Streptosporangiaceae bacterium]
MSGFDFCGRAIIVTGGTRGIGAGVASAFLASGARVLVCGRTQPSELPAADGVAADFVAADVRDPDQARLLIDVAVDLYGRLDVVINNAGGAPPADAATVSPRFHAKVIELNLTAPLHVSQAANAVMQARDGGSIIMIGSVSGDRPSPGTAAYGAAKAGLAHLAVSLAVEWAPKVRVNTVVAGLVGTAESAAHYGGDAAMAAAAATVPLGRMAVPQDVANACLFLASPMAGQVSGASLLVHGGGERPPFLASPESGRAARMANAWQTHDK